MIEFERRVGFDNEKYLNMQSERIRERISRFGGKLYMEFGGKLFDDFHASRVLPGFEPDSKLRMLLKLRDKAEIVIAVSASALARSKKRGDIGITYGQEVLRLADLFRAAGLYVGSVVVTQYDGQPAADSFISHLQSLGMPAYRHYLIEDYPADVRRIVSEEGFGKNDYIPTTRPLIVVTAPGPSSGKMAACLSQLYQENKRGIKAGYAKFETFPVWNLPLSHPVNLAYEAATADLMDVNMIDPYHLEKYGKTTVNYNRDIEIFPVLEAMFREIYGKSPYSSPTDMGVNMAGMCIVDDDYVSLCSRQEIVRRYFQAACEQKKGRGRDEELRRLQVLMQKSGYGPQDYPAAAAAEAAHGQHGEPAAALELADGTIITGRNKEMMGAASAMLLNALKYIAEIPDEVRLLSPEILRAVQDLKVQHLGNRNPRLHVKEALVVLSVSAAKNEDAARALKALPCLRRCSAHSSVILSEEDAAAFRRLGVNMTCTPQYSENRLYHG